MTIPERCQVALAESLADLDPEVRNEILASVGRLPCDGNPESYIQAMRPVIASVVERWLAANNAKTEERLAQRAASQRLEEFRATDTSSTIH